MVKNARDETQVGFLLTPDFPLMSLSSALEVLRHANRFAGREVYTYRTYTQGGGLVTASNGLGVQAAAPLEDDACPRFLFVVCGLHPEREAETPVLSWMRRLERRGAIMGGISAGAFLLAQAGLLDGRPCAVHWEYAVAFRESFPNVDLTDRLFVTEGGRWTCGGGAATIDMFLRLVDADLGHDVAGKVAEQLLIERVRSTMDRQASAALFRAKGRSEALAAAIEAMERNIDAPLSMIELAAVAGLTRRQLHRLFRQHTGSTPTDFYRDLRLRYARTLLMHTPAKVIDVALAAGFGSHSHFTKVYRERFGISPLKDRRAEL